MNRLRTPILVFALCFSSVTQAQTTPEDADAAKPIATVNGVAIPPIFAEFLRNSRAARGQPAELLSDTALREALIVAEILAQEAVHAGLDKDPRVSALIDFQRKEILGRALLEEHLRRNPISEETVRAEYEKAKERAGTEEYRVRHILVDSEQKARDIIARIKSKKAKFEDIAKTQSLDPSGAFGGDLGWTVPADLVPEFANALTKLKKGQLADKPVQTRFGWHVIRLEDTRKLQFPAYEEVRDRIVQQLQQMAARNYVRELAAKAEVE